MNTADVTAMNALDEIYTRYPFYGSRRMKYELRKGYGMSICREHIQRLMRQMGLTSLYPKEAKNLSHPDQQHRRYPYLLKDITAQYPNHISGYGHHLHTTGKRFCLSCSPAGLVFPVRCCLAGIGKSGHEFLYGESAASAQKRRAGYSQL